MMFEYTRDGVTYGPASPDDYDDSYVRREVADMGGSMVVDEVALQNTKVICAEEGVSQDAFDRLTGYHARLMKHYFTPANYSFGSRLKIAFAFLRG
ncbi:MAG: hypothetical protein VW338_09215 [Rhodospirillaceae bacterium]